MIIEPMQVLTLLSIFLPCRRKRETSYLLLPMRNMAVPQVGHTPLVAGLTFFMVTALALFISFLARHFTQYASIFDPHVIR